MLKYLRMEGQGIYVWSSYAFVGLVLGAYYLMVKRWQQQTMKTQIKKLGPL